MISTSALIPFDSHPGSPNNGANLGHRAKSRLMVFATAGARA